MRTTAAGVVFGLAVVLAVGAAYAATEDFEGFTTTPADLWTNPPGTWTTNGSIIPVDTWVNFGAAFEVRNSGDNYLYVDAYVDANHHTNYTDLGRATSSLGEQFTPSDKFQLSFDVLGLSGGDTFNGLAFGLQDNTGTDDGSREGLAITINDTVWPPANWINVRDLASWNDPPQPPPPAGYPWNFQQGGANLAVNDGAFDELRMTYDASFVVLEVLNSGSVIGITTNGYIKGFGFGNFIVMQNTGTANSGAIGMSIDDLTVTRLESDWLMLEDFESYGGTPVDISAGGWTTAGTISPVDDGVGANFEVRDGNILHMYGSTQSNGVPQGVMSNYTDLGRAIMSLGGRTYTTNDAFTLAFDVVDMPITTAGGWNSMFVGLQNGNGPDDGSRPGLGVALMDPGWSSPFDGRVASVWPFDMSSFSTNGSPVGADFIDAIDPAKWIIVDTGQSFVQVRLTYDNSMATNVQVTVHDDDGTLIGSQTWDYPDDFAFKNLVVGQGCGDADCLAMTVDIDHIRLTDNGSGNRGTLVVIM